MNKTTRVRHLIKELVTDSVRFNELGKAYEMLQCYFDGVPIKTLRPLLHHHDGLIRRSAMFVASELGKEAKCLIRDVAPLIHDSDPHTQWYALETVMVCSTGAEVDLFLCVINELENDDISMRQLAMRLISNADLLQLQEGYKLIQPVSRQREVQKAGLLVLCKEDSVDELELSKMLDDEVPLTRKYGVIAAKRLFVKFPKLLENAILNSDPDVSRFSREEFKRILIMKRA